VSDVVLTGQVTEQCIHYSALDAYVRQYSICVPSDAVAPRA
jgi:nicotinamidase-related amidase